jgi:hypothetical protein
MGIGAWQKKYFILSENIVTYCSEKGGNIEGKIHMHVAHIEPGPANSPIFKINTGVQSLKLRAENLNAKSRWLNALYDN